MKATTNPHSGPLQEFTQTSTLDLNFSKDFNNAKQYYYPGKKKKKKTEKHPLGSL